MTSARLGGVLFLLLSGCYGYFAGTIPLDYWSEQEVFNARSLPYAIACASVLCALLLILVPGPGTDWAFARQLNWRPALLLLMLMSAYGALLETLGFIVATVLFLVTAFLCLGVQSIPRAALVAFGIGLVFWLLMDQLGIYLAPGDLVENLLAYIAGEPD
ncbi:MAG: tripartite tricarboxylate transporter TctB family protein [Pseudomonadales bacterium]|jgi:putative tricarboxylic transport membrane protein|nr:tripartite tricarboxylate transporter TctB family protein [Pseudomonadales bacterium]MDP4639516.1 tripartite tricarboxylate transporter TctB family protein [Pseudomonadales bacterium]MDP4764889.1 tripartite tricarboxylate transporter TctB family protein [Pseudomonadales bacterium]